MNSLNNDSEGDIQNGTAADFLEPCYSLPDNDTEALAAGWTKILMEQDDGFFLVEDLGFTFDLYGNSYRYNQTYINANGFISFSDGAAEEIPFFSVSFPNDVIDMVAPFWADVDIRKLKNGNSAGEIWYQKFGDHLAVVYNQVGFANARNPTYKRNTFQVVISNGASTRLGKGLNVCFCYVDMDWWNSLFNPFDSPATVGINSATPFNNSFQYVQVGRFGEGSAYDGPGGNKDGIDWLDYQGSTIKRDPEQLDPIQGMCFSSMLPENVPPVASGFPADDTYNIPCRGTLDLSVAFATPEEAQKILVTLPPNIDSISGLRYNKTTSNAGEFVSVELRWSPDFATQSGTYTLVFVASDDYVKKPAKITKTLTINVAQCGGSDDIPNKCVPIIGGTCTAGNPQPFCTPYRSAEHCPMDESFPTYIRARNQIVQTSPSTIEQLGYWFHYLQDKAAAFAFTAASGYHAPKVLCCASPSTWATDCAAATTGSGGFVIRAVGDQHSNAAVYVLPSGFGGPELTRPLSALTQAQVVSNINGLTIPPTKIIVEEFIQGSGGSLPDEYKIHAFNGTVGAISMILNRGTNCACYAEVDQDWNRLDLNGCFVPNMPFGLSSNQACFDIDFDEGKKHPHPMKGHDLCGKLPLVSPSCLLAEMVAAAEAISKIIGVYVRIDMFVSGDNKLFIQEYTFNHNNGLRHCASKRVDSLGCIDSCFLGRMWKNNAKNQDQLVLGGPATPVPSVFAGWGSASLTSQCLKATTSALPATHLSCSK